jgi:hypothetical protein
MQSDSVLPNGRNPGCGKPKWQQGSGDANHDTWDYGIYPKRTAESPTPKKTNKNFFE